MNREAEIHLAASMAARYSARLSLNDVAKPDPTFCLLVTISAAALADLIAEVKASVLPPTSRG